MNILVIKSHPNKNSYCHALADEYIRGALKTGNVVNVIELMSLNLEPYLKEDHKNRTTLSSELLSVQELISSANCIVFAYPIWWATPPSLLKVFIEVILASGFAFKYHPPQGIIIKWDKLLKGKSARMIATMDSPPLYYKLFLGNASYKMMKSTLQFCGVKPIRNSYFGSVKMSSENKRKKWLITAYKIGLREGK